MSTPDPPTTIPMRPAQGAVGGELRDQYLDLLESSLLAVANGPIDGYLPVPTESGGSSLRRLVQRYLVGRGHSVLAHRHRLDPTWDVEGRTFVTDLFPGIMTMVGRTRLDHTRACVVDTLERSIPGDLIETGVWRGGTSILMRGVLKAYGVSDRSVYAADSFKGLPAPDLSRFPADEGSVLHEYPQLAVSLAAVRDNFARYGLLDDQVVFVPGWFRETLPSLRDRTWAVVRLDGDLYESTMDGLTNLYEGLSSGGWLIIDDWEIPACRAAVGDFRRSRGIDDEILTIDAGGVCWRKGSGPQ